MQAIPSREIQVPAPVVAMSADGGLVVRLANGELVVRGGDAIVIDGYVVAVAVLADAVWAITHAANGHALHRLDARTGAISAIGEALALGELGANVAISATRSGARHALVQGARAAVEAREDAAGAVTVVELGRSTADRRILLAGRGMLERRNNALVTIGPSTIPALALPMDLACGHVCGGAIVLDGAAVMIELCARGKRNVLVYDLRQGTVRTRVRLGEASVVAVAEKRSLVMLGRGAHLATLDLRQGRCTNERILPAAFDAIAIDAHGARIVVADRTGSRVLGAALTEVEAHESVEDDVASAEATVREYPEAPEQLVAEFAKPAPARVPAPVAPIPANDDDEVTEKREVPTRPAASPSALAIATTAGQPAALDASELARYHDDVFALIAALCTVRATLATDARAMSPSARVMAALSTAPAGADSATHDAFAKLSTWERDGVPHVELAKELGLSKRAALILLVVAAPQLWSEAARAFEALGAQGRPLVDEMLLAELLGVSRAQRVELARELDDTAPLRASGAIVRGEGTRMFAALSVHDGVVARLRGIGTALIGGSAAIAKLADEVEPAAWSSLVLPAEIDASLRELVSRVKLRDTVLDTWGLSSVSRARGVTALFKGGPGTGKSLAAAAFAGALGLPLYRVDVSRMFSKWIGETERNLGALFDAAEAGKFVILFDEADSLFGKRSEVESSTDRYANLEVNYLLQRLDRFNGIAILTTNFGTAIDPAFQRRLACELQFPTPDEANRLELWRAHLPASVPTDGDLGLAELAAEYPLSGGYIRNITLRACYLAAAAEQPLRAAHLRRAVELEYADRGKLSATGALN